MPDPILSIDEVLRLPPRIFGTIRWKKSIGRPTGDLCAGFSIKVEEHTATQFLSGPGGIHIPKPGTGILRMSWNRCPAGHEMTKKAIT